MKTNRTARQIWRQFLNNDAAELVAVARPVIRQLGGINSETLQNLEAVTRASSGAAAGFTGFIYYTETAKFWRTNRAAIYRLMQYDADGLGANIFEMVSHFRTIEGYTPEEIGRALFGNYSDDLTQIYNTFAWFALEEVAYRFGEYLYENGINIYSLS